MKSLLTLTSILALGLTGLPFQSEAADKKEEPAPQKCPICCKEANPKCTVEYEGKTYTFRTGECRTKFNTLREESLYHQLGGKAAIDAAVDSFYKKVLVDDRIKDFFEDVDMKRQHRKQKAFLSAALGGPEPWTGKDLRRAHSDVDLNDSHFDAVAENLQKTLAELKVDEALIGQVMAVVGSVRDDVLNRKKVSGDGEKKSGEKESEEGDSEEEPDAE